MTSEAVQLTSTSFKAITPFSFFQKPSRRFKKTNSFPSWNLSFNIKALPSKSYDLLFKLTAHGTPQLLTVRSGLSRTRSLYSFCFNPACAWFKHSLTKASYGIGIHTGSSFSTSNKNCKVKCLLRSLKEWSHDKWLTTEAFQLSTSLPRNDCNFVGSSTWPSLISSL